MSQWNFHFQCERKISTQNFPWSSSLRHLLNFQVILFLAKNWSWTSDAYPRRTLKSHLGQLIYFFFLPVKSGTLITLVMPDHSVSIPGLSSETNELSWWLQSRARVSQASCELWAHFLLLPINLFQFYIHSSLKHLNSHWWPCSSALDIWDE